MKRELTYVRFHAKKCVMGSPEAAYVPFLAVSAANYQLALTTCEDQIRYAHMQRAPRAWYIYIYLYLYGVLSVAQAVNIAALSMI